MIDEYVQWLLSYFSAKSPLPANALELNYFEAGLMDSLGVIEFIEIIESHFNIRFNAMVFQEKRFATIRGLAEIIDEMQQAKRLETKS